MKTVYVLGAGVDCVLGLPLADGLLRELDAFSKGDGRNLSRTIKNKLGGPRRVPFSFEKFVANQGESFPERMLTDSHMAAIIEGALERIGPDSSESIKAISEMVARMSTIRNANEFDELTAEAVASLARESSNMADHYMYRFRGVTLNPTPRDAVVKVFRDIQTGGGLSDEEKQAFDAFVSAMTNVEELLAELFGGFYAGDPVQIRKFLYVSWLLWGYMWWKSQIARNNIDDIDNFYRRLTSLGVDDSVITFNYTALGNLPADRTLAFHGDCFSYIRRDRGELITDERVTNAENLEHLSTFIDTLEMDIEKQHIFLPAIVPPSAMKPVIHRSFVTRWAEADKLLRESELLVAVGYAFNPIDSHFNDLFRSSADGKKVAVINPDSNGSIDAVCGLLGRDRSALTIVEMYGVQVHRSDQLLFVPVKSEDVTEDMLSTIRGGWSH